MSEYLKDWFLPSKPDFDGVTLNLDNALLSSRSLGDLDGDVDVLEGLCPFVGEGVLLGFFLLARGFFFFLGRLGLVGCGFADGLVEGFEALHFVCVCVVCCGESLLVRGVEVGERRVKRARKWKRLEAFGGVGEGLGGEKAGGTVGRREAAILVADWGRTGLLGVMQEGEGGH